MSRLRMPATAAVAIARETRKHGALRQETGGFVLASPALPDELALVAFAGKAGVVRRRGLFRVSAGAVGRLFEWAGERDLTIRAQFHSHWRQAFLSPTDIESGFTVEGFTTAVVPWFEEASEQASDWGWWRCGNGEWIATEAPEPTAGEASVVRFDEEGVR